MTHRLYRLVAATAVAAPVLASLAGAQTAVAAPVTCSVASLVAAINAANGAAGATTVTLPAGCTYTLAAANNATDGGTGLPVITGKVTVVGSGSTITRSAVAATPAFRIFDVATGGSLTLSSLTLSHGLADNGTDGGGAIYSHGSLSVSASHFTDNSSPAATGTSGGAINSSGTLKVNLTTFSGNSGQEGGGIFSQSSATVTQSTFTDNAASDFGGGALVSAVGTTTLTADTFVGNTGPGGGAIDNDATVDISDSTFFNNTGGVNGGGAVQNFGTANIMWSTLSGNSSPFGADIHSDGATLSVSSSIVAGGIGSSNCSGSVPITDGGYNIDSGASCGFSAASHSMSSTNPDLKALASNGGPTQTMALPAGSPAVGAIPAIVTGCTGSTDQRGIPRPQGQGHGCDIGAYELIVSAPITGIASKCLDDFRGRTANYSTIDLWKCNGTAAQRWTAAAGRTVQVLGRCLENFHGLTANGNKIDLSGCNGTAAQEWVHQSDGAYLNPASGKCLDDYGAKTANGSKIVLWRCTPSAAEKWTGP
jgi:Ricin-type beta-trefoil lectin domain